MRIEPPPYRDVLTHRTQNGLSRTGEPGTMTFVWQAWIQTLVRMLLNVAAKIGSVTLSAQSAAIPTTVLATSTLATTCYRVSYTTRVVTPASTTSALTVTIGWTDGGVSCTQSGAMLTGNTSSTQENATLLICADKGTSVIYSTAYTSVGATSMTYNLSLYVEELA